MSDKEYSGRISNLLQCILGVRKKKGNVFSWRNYGG